MIMIIIIINFNLKTMAEIIYFTIIIVKVLLYITIIKVIVFNFATSNIFIIHLNFITEEATISIK